MAFIYYLSAFNSLSELVIRMWLNICFLELVTSLGKKNQSINIWVITLTWFFAFEEEKHTKLLMITWSDATQGYEKSYEIEPNDNIFSTRNPSLIVWSASVASNRFQNPIWVLCTNQDRIINTKKATRWRRDRVDYEREIWSLRHLVA